MNDSQIIQRHVAIAAQENKTFAYPLRSELRDPIRTQIKAKAVIAVAVNFSNRKKMRTRSLLIWGE